MEEQKPVAESKPEATPAPAPSKPEREYVAFGRLRSSAEYLAVNIPLLIGVEFLKTPFDRLKTQTMVADTLKTNFVERQSLASLSKPTRGALWIGLRANVYNSLFSSYLVSRLSPSVTYAYFGNDLSMVKDSHGLSTGKLFLLGTLKAFTITTFISAFLYPLDMARTLLFCHSDLDPLTRVFKPNKALSKCIEKNGFFSIYRGYSMFLAFGLFQATVTGALLATSQGDPELMRKQMLFVLPLSAVLLYPVEAMLRNMQVGNLGLVGEKVGYKEAAKRTLAGLRKAPAGIAHSLASVGVGCAAASLLQAAARKH